MYFPLLVGMLCFYALLCALSGFAIIMTCCFAFIVLWTSDYCKCSVALPQAARVGLQCVIVVFPDYTHLLFIYTSILFLIYFPIIPWIQILSKFKAFRG